MYRRTIHVNRNGGGENDWECAPVKEGKTNELKSGSVCTCEDLEIQGTVTAFDKFGLKRCLVPEEKLSPRMRDILVNPTVVEVPKNLFPLYAPRTNYRRVTVSSTFKRPPFGWFTKLAWDPRWFASMDDISEAGAKALSDNMETKMTIGEFVNFIQKNLRQNGGPSIFTQIDAIDASRTHVFIGPPINRQSLRSEEKDYIAFLPRFGGPPLPPQIDVKVMPPRQFTIPTRFTSANPNIWSDYCSNPSDPITLASWSEYKSREDIVSILPPEGAVGKGGYCIRREDLVASMKASKIWKWIPTDVKEPSFGKADLKVPVYKLPLGFWVDQSSFEAVQRIVPRYVTYQLQPLEKMLIGSTFGMSNIHGQLHMIYELIPIQTAEEFHSQIAQQLQKSKQILPAQKGGAFYFSRRPLRSQHQPSRLVQFYRPPMLRRFY